MRGILTVVMMQELPEGASCKLLNALFENVPCQQQQLIDRQLIYRIFKEILNRRAAETIAMGIDFVLGVIQAIDGERDPRNLLMIFNWLPQFLSTVKLGHLAEEMFDVIACYFPVDFRSPSQDAQVRIISYQLYTKCSTATVYLKPTGIVLLIFTVYFLAWCFWNNYS